MSHSNGIPFQEYQARFGQAPGTQEPATERERWQQVCQQLAEELDKAREDCEAYRRLAQRLLPIEFDEEIANLSPQDALKLARDHSFGELIKQAFSE